MKGRNCYWVLLLVRFCCASGTTAAQSLPAAAENRYYQFYISYKHSDHFDYENYYYLKEKDFWSFDPETGNFSPFSDDIFSNKMPVLGKLSSSAGMGISYKSSRTAHPGFPVRVLDKEYLSTNIYDSSEVSVIAFGINKENASAYEYRLVLNKDSLIKDWSEFSVFKTVPQNNYSYAHIGLFSYPGNLLLIEVRDKSKLQDAGSIIINWPRHSDLTVELSRIYFKEDNPAGSNGYLEADFLRKGYASGKDSITGILKDLQLPGDKEYLSFIFDLNNTEITVPYAAKLVRNIKGKKDTVEINNYFNEKSIKIPSYFLNSPGKYNFLIGGTYYFSDPATEQWILNIPFEILPVPLLSEKWSLREIVPVSVVVLFLIILFFYFYYRFNKRKLTRIELEKQLNSLQLRSLQDQLNPHFLFNALNAIQNLVSKADLENASLYLQRFSLLTRTVLSNSRQEMISLEDELQILRSYLEMEQLRAPFRFSIEVDEKINKANTEIPVMLLQPFVENAVKHGVSSVEVEGAIEIIVSTEGQSLIFSIKDNGKGVQNNSTAEPVNGWGLSVLQKRINLLNERYKACIVRYEMISDEKGTLVKIHLKNWLN